MSKVALRVYNREIETMIEGGKLDEAVAHCQNILKTFPMHIETYKLLGKSFLEARRYTDAADIFQRTLMAVPDDFVAHVGMSIIRDDEGKLDDAIWHMERAFEDQPSNLAIQSELRRLYGRRDGIEPPKIRLTRDALANMYAQGGLYIQAIAEIRAVLALDPDRSDLQVMLARAYYRAGQKVEAAEVAANLLKKYAYCLDALRVLVDVLPEESQTENTQVYRQRLHLLDPYSSFVTGSVFGSDQVSDGSVTVDRLEYVAGAAPVSPQPNWATALGIKLGEEKPGEPIPSWVTPGTDEKPPAAQKEIPEVVSTPPSDENSIPDWMQNVGWKESSGNVPEPPPISVIEKPAVPLDKGDMPDWLKSMEPQAISSESPAPEPMPPFPSSPEAGGAPEWLSGLGTIKAVDAQPESPVPPETPKDTNIFPDWLKEMEPEGGPDSAQTIPQEKMEEPGYVDITGPEQPVEYSPEILESPPPQPSTHEWGEDSPLPPTGDAKPLIVEDDTLGWLESLAAKQGAKEEELLIKPENRTGDMPGWLRTDGEQAPVQIPPESSASLSETLPLEPFTLPGRDLVEATPETVEETPSIDAVVEPVQPQIIIQDDKPAWLAGAPAVEEITPQVEQEPQPVPPAEEIPPVDPSVIPPAPQNLVEDREAWLKDLAITEPAPKPEELPPFPGTPLGEIPPVEHAEESSQPFSTDSDTEAWLQGLAEVDQRTEFEESQPQSTGSSDAGLPEALPESDLVNPSNINDRSNVALEDLESLHENADLDEFQLQTISPAAEVPAVEPEITPLEPLRIEAERGGWQENLTTPEPKPEVEETQPKSETEINPVLPDEPAFSPTPPFNVGDDTDAWLEGLPLPEIKTLPVEIPPAPVDHPAAPPDWIQKPTPEPAAQEHTTAAESSIAPMEEDITITSWLNKHDVEAAVGKARSEAQVAPAQESPVNDLPDWLKEPEPVSPPEIEDKPDEKMPEWLSETVHLPDLGELNIPASPKPSEVELPPQVDESIPVSVSLAPTNSVKWIPVEEIPSQTPALATEETPSEPVQEPPIQRQILGGTGMLSRVPLDDKDAEFLAAAQTALDSKQINESMQAYSKLIKKNRLLDEVIHDLREAIYRFPVDVSIWQMLGDASMRANRLQDALDAYTKAEELLR